MPKNHFRSILSLKMSDNESFATTDSELTLLMTPSPEPPGPRLIDISSIRLNGDSIFYWEKVCTNPLKNSCWEKITHVFIDELFVNKEDQICKKNKKLFIM